jgi:hypothetical protein
MRVLLLAGLVAIRLPSCVQPAGGDQGLYAYEGQRLLAGAVPYRDTWDQKPPAIAVLYAGFVWAWPSESVVAAADLSAAALVAWLLVVIGKRRFTTGIGFGAASLFLLLGDPYLQRLSGVYVRGQCESFMALAVTVALALLSAHGRRRKHLIAAGAALAAACWLKYNAITYVLPIATAGWIWQPHGGNSRSSTFIGELTWVAVGAATLTAGFVAYFAIAGALSDFWLATVAYNLRYSDETYAGPLSAMSYVATLPIERARVDMLWFVGGLGSVILLWTAVRGSRLAPAVRATPTSGASVLVVLTWQAAAVLSIAVNGHRDLPHYFVQAHPALALGAAAGLATAFHRPISVRVAAVAVLVAGLWKVGADEPVRGLRWAGMPGLIHNARFDWTYARGRLDRETYLGRFRGAKHDALEVDDLARYVRDTTSPDDRIFVFGFSGGSICWKSGRVSASRFFWSRPILIEFGVGRPGYGSAGLLADLQSQAPVVVALQREQWGSQSFFMNNGALRAWLEANYILERDSPMFAVWRRRS